jgi:hypothetical protein
MNHWKEIHKNLGFESEKRINQVKFIDVLRELITFFNDWQLWYITYIEYLEEL